MISLICSAVILINISSEPWNDRDMRELRTSKTRCQANYPKSPCLKKFVKKGKLWYYGVCSKPRES
jgi:hypothetical protein